MKGISHLMAVILLLFITVSTITMAFFWFGTAASGSVKRADNYSDSQIQQAGGRIMIVRYEGDDVYIKNTGRVPITQPGIYVNDALVPYTGPTSLSAGTIGTYHLDSAKLCSFSGSANLTVSIGKVSDMIKIDVQNPDIILLLKKTMGIDENGNVYLKGTLTHNMVSIGSTADDEFRILDSGGANSVVINLVSGNMFIKGSLHENFLGLTPSPTKFELVIRNTSGDALVILDEYGNFYLKGVLNENSDKCV